MSIVQQCELGLAKTQREWEHSEWVEAEGTLFKPLITLISPETWLGHGRAAATWI